jgi:hypothetical protein
VRGSGLGTAVSILTFNAVMQWCTAAAGEGSRQMSRGRLLSIRHSSKGLSIW